MAFVYIWKYIQLIHVSMYVCMYEMSTICMYVCMYVADVAAAGFLSRYLSGPLPYV